MINVYLIIHFVHIEEHGEKRFMVTQRVIKGHFNSLNHGYLPVDNRGLNMAVTSVYLRRKVSDLRSSLISREKFVECLRF